MTTRPDTAAVIAGLKDFQKATVDYVFERFYGPHPTKRFLVADEVGLGKTLVARGVTARTIDHLWQEGASIEVIYICSNADIARQNIQRLRIPGCKDAAQSTRLTLLPLQLPNDRRTQRVNFVALTPGTSFEQSAGGGRVEERVVLYWLLDRAWHIHGPRSSLYVLKDYASAVRFEREVEAFERKLHASEISINDRIVAGFVEALQKSVADDRAVGKPDLRTQFDDLRGVFSRVDSRVTSDQQRARSRWIGELRRLLGSACLSELKPDLIIMDEFQRFKHLLDGETDAGELARELFQSTAGEGARVLLLSATPYRSLSLHHETDDDHYADFLALLRFLEEDNVDEYKRIISEYRSALPSLMTADGLDRLLLAKEALERRLRRVMARTERLASDAGRGGMLWNAPANASLDVNDVRAYLAAQRIADVVEQGDVVEYWKSAPYLFNFMDDYALKEAFTSTSKQHDLLQLVRKSPEAFLDLDRVRAYQPVESMNARLRTLLAETVDSGMWRLLWIPPTLAYYEPTGAFAALDAAKVTKRLVFSAWHMVPRAVAPLLSYEAERRMMRAAHPRAQLTQEDWQRQRGLLRFSVSAERLTGMPLLLLIYPCLTFMRHGDPRDVARDGIKSASDVRSELASRIRTLIANLRIAHQDSGAADERWYWLAPMLLDYAEFPEIAKVWWTRPDLSNIWQGAYAGDEDAGWSRHVDAATHTLAAIRDGTDQLGRPPDDLYDVLALAASAGPAVAVLRAFERAPCENAVDCVALLDYSARTGRAFLTLFNHPEVIEMVRAESRDAPYWQCVLDYAHNGCLQAVLDEYAHLLKESLGIRTEPAPKMAEKISAELFAALTLRTASLRIDEITAPRYAREVKVSTAPMHVRFAMRFGDDRTDEEVPAGFDIASAVTRKERVRAAFNSPFWPFVLVTTSVGQEGLDFHHYCHAITHWNLPSNPVDLEQREGRIHRYKGHAVRKNVAATYGAAACSRATPDVWQALFDLARENRLEDSDLVPYWLFAGDAKIERHVPALPYSREIERLHELCRSLAIYRMVFGQSRQEDLIHYLLSTVPEEQQASISEQLKIDLSPASCQTRYEPRF